MAQIVSCFGMDGWGWPLAGCYTLPYIVKKALAGSKNVKIRYQVCDKPAPS